MLNDPKLPAKSYQDMTKWHRTDGDCKTPPFKWSNFTSLYHINKSKAEPT